MTLRITKMSCRNKIGLACIISSIITTLITSKLSDAWLWTPREANILIIGSILIIGFSLGYKLWLLILLPVWIFCIPLSSGHPTITITNYADTPCTASIVLSDDSKVKTLSLPPNESKTICTIRRNEFYLIYQFENQPKKFKHLTKSTDQNTIDVKLGQATSKPAAMN